MVSSPLLLPRHAAGNAKEFSSRSSKMSVRELTNHTQWLAIPTDGEYNICWRVPQYVPMCSR